MKAVHFIIIRLFSYMSVATSTLFAPPWSRKQPCTNSSELTVRELSRSRSLKRVVACSTSSPMMRNQAITRGSCMSVSNSLSSRIPEPSASISLKTSSSTLVWFFRSSMSFAIIASLSTAARSSAPSTNTPVMMLSTAKSVKQTKIMKISAYVQPSSFRGAATSPQSAPPDTARKRL